MGKGKKIVLALIVIVVLAFVVVNVTGWSPELKPVTLNLSEKATIQKVTFDSPNNALLLDVQSTDTKTIVFQRRNHRKHKPSNRSNNRSVPS